jgi:transaldolase
MKENPLHKLEAFGQSIWLDHLDRRMLSSGELQELITEDGLSGITSNPKIFSDAITGSSDYDEAIEQLAKEGKTAEEIYEAIAVEDIRHAADILRSVYERTKGKDGFISLEVSPHLADDTHSTIAEARRLWAAVDRPNTFIKVPATKAGLPAIRRLTSDGVKVNVTLLFGLDRYKEVADSYIAGLEARVAAGQPLDEVSSVASFFLSRIDVLVDPILEKLIQQKGPKAQIAEGLRGQTAIACAKLAYQIYKEIFGADRFRRLAEKGARPQRVLWGSTSTKNPSYSDVKYVEPLIGPETINTVPKETLNAYRDHGEPAARLEDDIEGARDILQKMSDLGIDAKGVSEQLEREGVKKFADPFDKLISELEKKRKAASEKQHALH